MGLGSRWNKILWPPDTHIIVHISTNWSTNFGGQEYLSRHVSTFMAKSYSTPRQEDEDFRCPRGLTVIIHFIRHLIPMFLICDCLWVGDTSCHFLSIFSMINDFLAWLLIKIMLTSLYKRFFFCPLFNVNNHSFFIFDKSHVVVGEG